MPEGPSIVLLKEEVKAFAGKKIIAVYGNSKIDQQRLLNKKIIAFKSWGKHFLICFKDSILRIHFLMFGSYRVNQKKDKPVRLGFTLSKGELNFYSCSVKLLEAGLDTYYDFSADVMNDAWDPRKAKKKLKLQPQELICDTLLDQEIFAGVGNIIKNEILYRVKIHPESMVGKIPLRQLNKLINETRTYSFQFLDWKRNYELKKHWLAHTKKICLRCQHPIIKKYTGNTKRRSFICEHCQVLYR